MPTTFSLSFVKANWVEYTTKKPWEEEDALVESLSEKDSVRILVRGRNGLQYIDIFETVTLELSDEEWKSYNTCVKALQRDPLYKWVVLPLGGLVEAKRFREADVSIAWQLYHEKFFEGLEWDDLKKSILRTEFSRLFDKAMDRNEKEPEAQYTVYVKTHVQETPAVEEDQ